MVGEGFRQRLLYGGGVDAVAYCGGKWKFSKLKFRNISATDKRKEEWSVGFVLPRTREIEAINLSLTIS